MASKPKNADENRGQVAAFESSIADLTSLVDDIRVRIDELKETREKLDDARISKAEALQRVDSWLTGLREKGSIAVSHLTYREPYTVELIKRSGADANGDVVMAEAAAAMVYFFHDAIRDKLAGEIDAVYAKGGATFSRTEYPRRVAEVDAELFAAELEEERMIQRAENAGLVIHRRHDVNPRALLEA